MHPGEAKRDPCPSDRRSLSRGLGKGQAAEEAFDRQFKEQRGTLKDIPVHRVSVPDDPVHVPFLASGGGPGLVGRRGSPDAQSQGAVKLERRKGDSTMMTVTAVLPGRTP